MSKMKKIATLIATSAAVAFVAAPFTATIANAKHVKCYGVNGCKGKSQCKTSQNACKGKNDCKGKGMMKMSEKKCEKKGGKMEETTSNNTNANNPNANNPNANNPNANNTTSTGG